MAEIAAKYNGNGHRNGNDSAPVLVVRDVHKTYNTSDGLFPALKGISLNIHAREFVTVIGKSGAGKSTLVNVVTGIAHADRGQIVIEGRNLLDMNEDQRARWRGQQIGVVFQFFQLMPSLTLVENITLAMDFTNSLPLKQRRARALELLDMVGIADHGHKIPSRISGGQQQRAAIARALANDPPILIADEPTGNLDSRTSAAIFELFQSLVAQGKSILMATHDIDLARLSTRTLQITDGEITQEWTH